MAQEEIYNIGFVQNSIIAAESTSGDGSNPFPTKKKRNLPGTPDPEAEVIALSPKALMATNRFLCEICGKGFQRDQNLQLHRRGHNLPWKLNKRSNKEPFKRVYVCPEKNCVHNHPSRALGDLTGIKKHFLRKHCEKKWKCDKCSKRYAVQYDWKAHSKTCGTREYRCDCGTLFSRRDSFLTHKTFCDALNEETARLNVTSCINSTNLAGNISYHFMGTSRSLRPGNNDEASEISQVSTCGIPLWMGNQITQDHDILGSVISSSPTTLTYGDPSHNSDYELMNWVFGNKIDSSSTGELIISGISHPLSNANNKELAVGSSDELLVSIPCLYSTQPTNINNAHQTLMSATALLQKATQIGVTTTSADSSFFGSLGVKCINNNQAQEGNNFCGLTGFYSSNPISTSQLRNNLKKGTEGTR